MKFPIVLAAATLAAFAGGVAFAQPASNDVGTITGGAGGTPAVTTFNVPVTPATVSWLKFTTAADCLAAGPNYLDIDTETTGGAAGDIFTIGGPGDTMIGLYRSTGALVNYDDDDGSYYRSALSYGRTTPTRAALGPAGSPGVVGNGRDGVLVAGTYYLGVDTYGATWAWGAANWGATSAGTQTEDVIVNFRTNLPGGGPSIVPSISGTAANPNAVGMTAYTTLLTVTVSPAALPPSTGITVTGDLSALGGSSTQAFFDNGTNGDVTAGDNIFSYFVNVNAPAAGAQSLPVVAADAQLRTANGSIAITVNAPTAIALTSSQFRPTSAGTGLAQAKLVPGTFPASTGINVTADLTAFGGGAADQLFDDGTNGDVTAGDNIYSRSFTLPTAVGTYMGGITAADAQSRTVSHPVRFAVLGDIGGSDSDLTTEDVLTFNVTSSVTTITWAAFSIPADVTNDANAGTVSTYLDLDTAGTGASAVATYSLNDTELATYDTSGALHGLDDDSGPYQNSQLSYGDTAPTRPALGTAPNAGAVRAGGNGNLTTGTYYIAIGNFNMEPTAGFTVTTTNGSSTPTFAEPGDYVINFRTNLTPATCSAADIGVQGGFAGHDNLLDNNDFIVYIANFFSQLPSADVGQQGGIPGQDGLWDNNDFIVFIAIFFTDQPNCNG